MSRPKENNSVKKNKPTSKLSEHINKALKKPASDDRLIFVDLNHESTFQDKPDWIEDAIKILDQKEKDMKEGQKAYIMVTNIDHHWHLDSKQSASTILGYGFGIQDFGKYGRYRLSDIYRAKQKHIDAHNIMKSFKTYPHLPTTFDGSMPSETFSKVKKHIKIGETYFFEDIGENGLIATVTSATVSVEDKFAYIGTDKGQILRMEMSDDEISDYKNHPDTYFGTIYRQGKKTDDPYEFFENMVEIHKSFPEDHIYKQIENWGNAKDFMHLDHENLILEYCERLTNFVCNKKKDG